MNHIYELLQTIRKSPSKIDKRNLLIQYDSPELRLVLEYALNPYKMYHIKSLPSLTSTGTEELGEMSWRLLNVLTDRSLSGKLAKETVWKYLSTLTIRSQHLFNSILMKNLDCGLGVKTVNSFCNGLIPDYQVMKAEEWDESRFVKGSFVGDKIDGIRATFKNGRFWTRSGRILTGLGHLEDKAKLWNLQAEWDGELDIPSVEFNKASGIIRSHADSKPGVRFTCFDVPLWDGGFHERHDYYYHKLWHKQDRLFRPLPHRPVDTVGGVLESFQHALDRGQEGIVIKTPNHGYVRKRCYDWMKMKLGETLDARVFDYQEGKGKFEGMIGKLIVQEEHTKLLHTIGVGKMTQEDQRTYFAKGFRQLENQLIEVSFMERQPSGELRHGRFSKYLWDR